MKTYTVFSISQCMTTYIYPKMIKENIEWKKNLNIRNRKKEKFIVKNIKKKEEKYENVQTDNQ